MGDKGGPRRATGLFQRRGHQNVAAQVGVLVAPGGDVAGERDRFLAQEFVEPLGDLAVDFVQAGRGRHVVVLVVVEHLDGLAPVGPAVLVDEAADARLSPLRRERHERDEVGL